MRDVDYPLATTVVSEFLIQVGRDASRDLVNAQEYGRGCYWFRKPSAKSV
jgi:hypothetical protein